MAKHEKWALESVHEDDSSQTRVQGHVRNLILPIVALIVATVAMMLYTGNQALAENNQPFSVLGAFENTTVGISLVAGGLASIIVVTVCILLQRQITMGEYSRACLVGMKSMLGAILILCFAWVINNVVGDMNAGKYLSGFVSENLPVSVLPALLFVLGAVMAFSTGTSWGTFGIMLPIAAAIAAHAAPELLLPCLSAVMAGAVCGDHCSPVSDTTILSSTGAKCNHMDHVKTQLPYALVVAVATIIGYLVVGLSHSGILGFAATALSLFILIFLFKKRIS